MYTHQNDHHARNLFIKPFKIRQILNILSDVNRLSNYINIKLVHNVNCSTVNVN